MMAPSVRAWLATAVAASLSLAGAILFYLDCEGASRQFPDPYKVGEQHQRMAGVVQALPPDAIVGYISDEPLTSPEGQAYFFSIQYAIAPRLLVEETPQRRQRWVVGSFLKRPDIRQIEQQYGLRLVRAFGLGVYLFERVPASP